MESKLYVLSINSYGSIRSVQKYSVNSLETRGPQDVFVDFLPHLAPSYNGTPICIELGGPSKN